MYSQINFMFHLPIFQLQEQSQNMPQLQECPAILACRILLSLPLSLTI